MIVLVTGANGLLGKHVVRKLLADGHEVHAFVRPGRGGELSGATIVEGDLRNADDIERAMNGVDAVVHSGALVAKSGPRAEFEQTNVEATRHIIDAAGGRIVVHISSLGVYAVQHEGEMVTEDSPYETGAAERGPYSRTKLDADRLAVAAGASGAPVTVVRPGVLYGPGRRPPLGRQSFAAGPMRFIPGSGDYLMPLAHVDNVADGIALALTGRRRGRVHLVDPQIPLRDYLAIYRLTAKASWRPARSVGTAVAGGDDGDADAAPRSERQFR
jgi:nucleoside-diphosphate-sugar epimerase